MATFGNWIAIGQKLAKQVRRFIHESKSNTENGVKVRTILSSMFETTNSNFLDLISNKQLYRVLSDVNQYRNSWKGHSGIISETDWESNLVQIEDKLSQIQSLISRTFFYTNLVFPEENRHKKGIFHYETRLIMGTNSSFMPKNFQLLKPMDDDSLYLIHNDSQRPLKILPFIRMSASPSSARNACYYYNRLDHDKVRFVSYHFDAESEKTEFDSEVMDLLEEIGD